MLVNVHIYIIYRETFLVPLSLSGFGCSNFFFSLLIKLCSRCLLSGNIVFLAVLVIKSRFNGVGVGGSQGSSSL